MRLTHFRISGHYMLDDLEVPVREHLVIVGGNDVGKTSILRLLNLLLAAPVRSLYQSLHPSDIREGEDVLVVEARLEEFTEDEKGKFPFQMTILDGEPDHLILRLEVGRIDGDAENVSIERFFPNSGNRRQPSSEQLTSIGWEFLPANRSSTVDYMDGRHSPFRTLLDSIELGTDRDALETLLESFNERLSDSEPLKALRSEIAAHLSRSVPRSYGADSLAIRTAANPAEKPLDDVTIFLKEGDALKGLSEQSDGMRQLMSLTFFDLAQAAANIVAVDEPEIHLHASSQRTVASLFAESKKQRIVVTHSPYVVQRFEPKHVLVIDPDRRGRQIPETSFSEVEKERIHWWSPQLLEGLTARRMLFVEGAADRVVVETAMAAVGLSLDRLGVSLFALDGADKFKHVLKVVGPTGLQIPMCGLCDEDREASWANLVGVKPKSLAASGFFIARKDLEHEYVAAIGAAKVVEGLINAKVAREAGLLQAAGATNLADLTDDQVADFITAKDERKIPAARVVASLLGATEVAASPALSGLIGFLRAQAPA